MSRCALDSPPARHAPGHAGALAARRGSVASLVIHGRWPAIRLSPPSSLSRDRSPRRLAVKARRAVSSPAAAGRTNPCASSLTASPRRPGSSRAMNSGKTVTHDGHGDPPRSLRRTHRSHTGLRILESGWFWKPQEGCVCRHQRRESTSKFCFLFLIVISSREGQELSP